MEASAPMTYQPSRYSASDLLENLANVLEIEDRGSGQELSPFGCYLQYAQNALRGPLGWLDDMRKNSTWRSVQDELSALMQPPKDYFMGRMWSNHNEFCLYQAIRKPIDFYPPMTESDQKRLSGRTFADVPNPFVPIIESFLLGVPWIGSIGSAHYCAIPSARAAR